MTRGWTSCARCRRVTQGTQTFRFLFGLSAIEVSRLAQTSEAQQQALLDEAIAALHVILVDQPELVRVRLELARAFFYKEEDTLSRGHFERVLAGDVPKAVKANGQRFLTQLRARRRWTMYMGAALLPDKNIGSGSEDEVIYINFGGIDLPFRRNNADNLTTSGVGTLLWAGASISTPSETGCGCAPARIFRGRNTRAGSSTISTCRFMPGCAGCWTGAPKQACSPARAVAGRAPVSIMTQWVGVSRPGIGSHRGSRRTPRLPGTGATTLWTDPWSTSP